MWHSPVAVLAPQNVTLLAWVRRSGSPGNYKYILAKGARQCSASSYALESGPSGGLVFYIDDGAQAHTSPDAGQGVWDGKWHMVAGSFDGSAVRLYVDGVEVGSGTAAKTSIGYAAATTSTDFTFGYYPAANLWHQLPMGREPRRGPRLLARPDGRRAEVPRARRPAPILRSCRPRRPRRPQRRRRRRRLDDTRAAVGPEEPDATVGAGRGGPPPGPGRSPDCGKLSRLRPGHVERQPDVDLRLARGRARHRHSTPTHLRADDRAGLDRPDAHAARLSAHVDHDLVRGDRDERGRSDEGGRPGAGRRGDEARAAADLSHPRPGRPPLPAGDHGKRRRRRHQPLHGGHLASLPDLVRLRVVLTRREAHARRPASTDARRRRPGSCDQGVDGGRHDRVRGNREEQGRRDRGREQHLRRPDRRPCRRPGPIRRA